MRTSPLALRREEQLLAAVAVSSTPVGGYPEGLAGTIASFIARDFDWDSFLRLAALRQYLPAAYRLLKDLGCLELMSERGRVLSEKEYVLSQARFIKKEAELSDIARAFADSGIEAVALKGVPLAHQLYRDPGVRTLKDTDILVRSDDVQAAREAIERKGYRLYTALRSAADYEKHHFHYVFSRGEKLDSIVEIHWSLVYPDSDHRVADGNAVFDRAISMAAPHSSLKTLSLPHAFWHMAMHVSYKSFLGFHNLAELRRIAMKLPEADWEYVAAWSRRCNSDIEVRTALELAESLFGAFVERGRDLKLRFPARTSIPAMFYPRALVWEWVPFRDTHALGIELMLRKSVASRLRCLYHFIFPDRRMAFKYYLQRGEEGRFGRLRSLPGGLYVVFKVLALVCFFPIVVRGRILGAAFLDPEKHTGKRDAIRPDLGGA